VESRSPISRNLAGTSRTCPRKILEKMPSYPGKLGNLQDEIILGFQLPTHSFKKLVHIHCSPSQSYDVLSSPKHLNHTQHNIVQQINVPVSQETPRETSAPSHP
jgi:hypothetical protein